MDLNTIPFYSSAFAYPLCEASLKFPYSCANTFRIVNTPFDRRDILTEHLINSNYNDNLNIYSIHTDLRNRQFQPNLP